MNTGLMTSKFPHCISTQMWAFSLSAAKVTYLRIQSFLRQLLILFPPSRSRSMRLSDEFQTEWWYLNGKLCSPNNETWFYHIAFFIRRTDQDFLGVFPLRWLNEELNILHCSLLKSIPSKKDNQPKFYQYGGINNTYNAKIDRQSRHLMFPGIRAHFFGDSKLGVEFEGADFSLKLNFDSVKKRVFHADAGHSLRGSCQRYFSHHSSLTNLKTSGVLVEDGERFSVVGKSWFDREKMFLHPDHLSNGWIWICLHLENDEELMIYLFNTSSGDGFENFSYGTYVDQKGISTHIKYASIRLEIGDYWKSPHSHSIYPMKFNLNIDELGIQVSLRALNSNCEMMSEKTCFLNYWEGPVTVQGNVGSHLTEGSGFLEMSGRDRRMRTRIIHSLLRPQENLRLQNEI